MTKQQIQTILIAGSEGGGYIIERQQTPLGPRFRLRCDESYFEEDITSVERNWVPTLQEAVAAMPDHWTKLVPIEAAPEHATELWSLYLATCKRQDEDERSIRQFYRWKHMLLVQSFDIVEQPIAFAENKEASSLLPQHWQPFATHLQAALAQMKEDQFLAISVKETNRFVQFAAQGAKGIRAEATSNHFLLGREKLDVKQTRTLAKLSWHKPTGTPEEATPERQPDGSCNFFVDSPTPVDVAHLASLAVRTLSEVFGAPHSGLLQYTAYDYAGNSLMLPDLQIKREQRDPALNMAELADRLLAVVRATTELPDLEFDSNGDILLSLQGKPLYIRLAGHPPMTRFFLPLMENVRTTRRLLDCLNQLNLSGGPSRYFIHKRNVCAVLDIPAWPLHADHVATSLARLSASMEGAAVWLMAELASGKGGPEKKVH